jgi:DNA-binding NtrC family response regulator
MAHKMRALLLQDGRGDQMVRLREGLRAQALEVLRAETMGDARSLLNSSDPPELIVTDVRLADGTWEDALRLSQEAPLPVNVIVVSRIADVRLYLEVLERGAFDFISPPFQAAELNHVLRTALGNVSQKRVARALPALPGTARNAQPYLALPL